MPKADDEGITPILLTDIEHLTCLRVVMFKKVYDLNPAEDLKMNVSKIGDHLQSQPSKYAFYATLRDLANSKVEKLSDKLHKVRGSLDSQYRAEGYLPGDVKITEDSMRRFLNQAPEVSEVTKEIRQAQSELAVLTSIVRAFEQRRDCLVALAHRQNSGVFHDKDATPTVHAAVTPLRQLQEQAAAAGAHPSKRK